MLHIQQWEAVSARIKGLNKAAELHARYLAIDSSDPYGRGRRLRTQCAEIVQSLIKFKEDFESTLPAQALEAINKVVADTSSFLADDGGSQDSERHRIFAMLVVLCAFETQLTFLLTDNQQEIFARSERAFAHLQRSVVADLEFRAKWKRAFDEGEVTCEKLGAVHLLLHGIWAFKVNTAGARTDLVFQNPITDSVRFADGLVLTEWKKANDARQVDAMFRQGREQAKLYSSGALAGVELATYRYVVVVSETQSDAPPNTEISGIIYRHVHLTIDPDTPSRAVRGN